MINGGKKNKNKNKNATKSKRGPRKEGGSDFARSKVETAKGGKGRVRERPTARDESRLNLKRHRRASVEQWKTPKETGPRVPMTHYQKEMARASERSPPPRRRNARALFRRT